MNNLNVNLNMCWGTFVFKKCIRRYASEKKPTMAIGGLAIVLWNNLFFATMEK